MPLLMSDVAAGAQASSQMAASKLAQQYAPAEAARQDQMSQLNLEKAQRQESDITKSAEGYSKIAEERLAANAAIDKQAADETAAEEAKPKPGGYETPEMQEQAKASKDFATEVKKSVAETQQLKMDHDDLIKRSQVAEKAHDPVTAERLRTEAADVKDKAQASATKAMVFHQAQAEQLARDASSYLANPSNSSWGTFVMDQVSNKNISQDEAMKLYNTPESQRKAKAEAAIDNAVSAADRTKRFNVQKQIDAKAVIADASNVIKRENLASQDRLRTADIAYKKIQGEGVQGKMLLDAQKNLISSTKLAQDGLNKEINQSDAKVKSLQADLKQVENPLTPFASKQDRIDAIDSLEMQIDSERKNGDKARESFKGNIAEFKSVLDSNPDKEVKELAEKSMRESVLRPADTTPEQPQAATGAQAKVPDIYAKHTPSQLETYALDAIKQEPNRAQGIKDDYKKATGKDLVIPGEKAAVTTTPVTKEDANKVRAEQRKPKAPEMSAADKDLMSALNKTSVFEDIGEMASSAGEKISKGVKSGFGLREKQEAEFKATDKRAAYAKEKMQDKTFMSQLNDRQKKRLQEISRTTGASQLKKLQESDTPFDLLPPALAASAMRVGGKPLIEKVEKVLERSPSEIEKHMAGLEKRVADATEGANIKYLRGFDKKADEDLRMVKEELRILKEASKAAYKFEPLGYK